MNISVHNRSSRTTNSLEAYNGVLGRKIGKKGHFFKFMEEIQDQEYSKRIDFDNLIKSGGASAASKRTRVCLILFFFIAFSHCVLFSMQ